MRHLVIGSRGQVGSAVQQVLEQRHGSDLVAGWDWTMSGDAAPPGPAAPTGLHVCIPGDGADFEQRVGDYQRRFSPAVTIVYSSTPIGTCARLGAVHSPIEGRHVGWGIVRGLLDQPRPIGCNDGRLLELAADCWGDDVIRFPSASICEFLKLRSTTLYGLQIAFAQYTADALDALWADDDEPARLYDRWYNEIFAGMDLARPILTAPGAAIGGHCVVPNAALLAEMFPHELVGIVAQYNATHAEPPVLL